MVNLRKNWWKILVISIIATFVDIAGHIIEGTPLPESDPLSFLSKAISVEAAASIYFIVFFSALSITFIIIEKWLTGNKIVKGLTFGIAWALIVFAGVCEINVVVGTPVIADLRMATVDAIPLLVLGLLLGKIFGTDERIETSVKKFEKINIVISFLIIMFFVIGRYFAYYILKIDSGQYERPFSTFIWTVSMAITFGILYLSIGRHIPEENLLKKATIFGAGIIGINWLIFNMFAPLILETSMSTFLLDFLIGRVVIDAMFILAGTLVGEIILEKYTPKVSYTY